jgi:hypothetical protein
MTFNVPSIVNDMGSHRVHTFIVPKHCSILAWRWLFIAETCCQNSKILSICWYIYMLRFRRYYIQFNSIYFVFCRSKGGCSPQDIEHVSIWYTCVYKLLIVSKNYPIITRFNILPWAISYNNRVSYNNAISYNNMVSYINKFSYM